MKLYAIPAFLLFFNDLAGLKAYAEAVESWNPILPPWELVDRITLHQKLGFIILATFFLLYMYEERWWLRWVKDYSNLHGTSG